MTIKLLSYPCDVRCEETSYLKTKRYWNREKLKEIIIESGFDNMTITGSFRRERIDAYSPSPADTVLTAPTAFVIIETPAG